MRKVTCKGGQEKEVVERETQEKRIVETNLYRLVQGKFSKEA